MNILARLAQMKKSMMGWISLSIAMSNIGLWAYAEKAMSSDPLQPGRVVHVIKLPQSKVVMLGGIPSAGDYVDVQTEYMGIISPGVREALVVAIQKTEDQPPVFSITFAVKPEDAKKLGDAMPSRGTYRLANLNGEPTWGKILKVRKTLHCEQLQTNSGTTGPDKSPLMVELDAKIFDPTPHVGPFAGRSNIVCESCAITAYVDKRATCEAISPGKTYFGRTLLGRLQIENVFTEQAQ